MPTLLASSFFVSVMLSAGYAVESASEESPERVAELTSNEVHVDLMRILCSQFPSHLRHSALPAGRQGLTVSKKL